MYSLYRLCTAYVQPMYSLYTDYVQPIYSLYTAYIQPIYSLCTVYVQLSFVAIFFLKLITNYNHVRNFSKNRVTEHEVSKVSSTAAAFCYHRSVEGT
jgi:hypothetical protein